MRNLPLYLAVGVIVIAVLVRVVPDLFSDLTENEKLFAKHCPAKTLQSSETAPTVKFGNPVRVNTTPDAFSARIPVNVAHLKRESLYFRYNQSHGLCVTYWIINNKRVVYEYRPPSFDRHVFPVST